MALVFVFRPVDYVKDNERLHKLHKVEYKFIKRFEEVQQTYKYIQLY